MVLSSILWVQREGDMHNRRLGSFPLALRVPFAKLAFMTDRSHTGVY